MIYSQEKNAPFFYSENGEIFNIDTNGLEKFHEYRIDNEYVWLGNNGQDGYSLIFKPKEELGYSASRLLGSKNAFNYKAYNVNVPFTSVKFVQGARLEQYFNLIHTQKFAEKGNFSLSYDKINSDGSYLRQKTNNNNLNASVWYETPKEKYKISLFANRIKNTVQQNGGLVEDSLFIVDSVFSTNRKTLQVNLDSAVELKIANQLALFQYANLFDNRDSLGFGIVQSLDLKSTFTNSKRFYTDGSFDTDFYQNIFLDSTRTNDSIKLNEVEQELTYRVKLTNNSFALALSPRLNYYYTDYKQADQHLWYDETSIGGALTFENSILELNSDFDLFLSGYRQANYQFENRVGLSLNKNIEWYLSANVKEYAPSLDLQNYFGNHSTWINNNFLNTQVLQLYIGTDNNRWGLLTSFDYIDIKNPIYFNHIKEVAQTQGVTQILKSSVQKEFEFKKWRITPKFVYQYLGGAIVYRLPNLFTSLKLDYQFNAFRKKLAVYTGIKATYYNKFQLMSYSPSLGEFYLANNQDRLIGNYPFLDFFVNARIKDVRLFFALTHVNQGLTAESNYFGAVNHPLEDRAYKVGIAWNFKK